MENLLVDVDFRRVALELANTYEGEPESVVARAETYYTFLKAGTDPAPVSGEASKPTRRGRPPKDTAAPAAAEVEQPAKPAAAVIDLFGDEPTPPPPPKITKEDLRAALVSAQKATSAEAVLALMKSVANAETLGAIPEDKYAPLMTAAAKLIADNKK